MASERTDYLPRHVDSALERALTSFPVVVLDGPRGAGKTTSAERLSTSVVRLPEDLDRLRVDATGLLESLPRPVLIDEWQLAGTDLLWTVKRIVDDDPTPGRFILAGSVEPATYGPTYPLTGRAGNLILRPMTTAELDGHGADACFLERAAAGEIPEPTAGERRRFALDWLQRPGFPAARAMADATLFLESYAALVAQRAGDEGRDATRLLKTLRVLATLEAQAVPDQRIWEAADINKATWNAYEDLLARTHLVAPLPAFSSNRLKRLTSYPKRFLADTAMALALAGATPDRLEREPTVAGQYLESFVLQQLRPQVDIVRGVLSHVRTGGGQHEVDAVVEIDDRVLAFEIKRSAQPHASDALALAWLRDQLGERFLRGYVLHTGADTYSLGERLWALPIETLTT